MAELTEKEMLLLSNLMYCPDGITVGDTVEEIVTGLEKAIDNGRTPNLDGAFDGESFKEMINYIKGDPKLMSLTVTNATPRYSDVRAACFVDDEGKATVAFEGTGGTQIAWSDDVKGENISDTACQSQAALFVKEMSSKYGPVDVTGHSKGGNMAMYSAVVCSGVANCISFDGQGFSEEFYAKYGDEVSANSGRIKNICAYNDFVNILMPSPGEKVYLQNPVNKFTERHYSSKLFINNFNGNYGDFGEGELISESQFLKLSDSDKENNQLKTSMANAPQLYTFVRNTALSGFVQNLRNDLDSLSPRTHQLFVDVASITVSGLLAGGDYSFDEILGDLGTAIGKYLGLIKKYTNASYSRMLRLLMDLPTG